MEKKNFNRWFVLMVVAAILGLVPTSCSKDEDEVKVPTIRTDTYAINPPFDYGSVLFNGSAGNWSLSNSWPESGYAFWVYISQNGNLTSVGKIHSKETNVDAADVKKALHVDVPIPQGIDINKEYKVLFFDSHAKPSLSGGRVVCNFDLEREAEGFLSGWYIAEGGVSKTAQSFYLSTGEGLYVKNNSGRKIKVKHKGFNTQQKWYYSSGTVFVSADGKTSTTGSFSSGEVESDEIEVESGDTGWILSTYIPSGSFIKDAQLILEIDGKIAITPAASSQVSIVNGHNYRMYVKWDGTNLEWN